VAFFLLTSLALGAETPDSPISFGYRINARPEIWHNSDFDFETEDTTWLYRQNIRLISTARWDGMVVKASFQDVRVWGTEQSPPASADSLAGLHEGYFQVGTKDNKSLWLRVGRQAFNFGKGNLLSAANWNAYGLAHDGFRIHNEIDGFEWDLLGIQQTQSGILGTTCTDDPGTADDECVDFVSESVRTAGDQLWVLTGKASINEQLQIEPYLLALLENENADNLERKRHIYSPGLLLSGAVSPSLRYAVEGTYQKGQAAEDIDHEAWKAVVQIDWSEGPAGTRIRYEENSGDGDPADSVDNNIEPFYPANHGFRGWSDKVGGINSRTLSLEGRYSASDHITLKIVGHHFALSNPEGSWYQNSGAPMGVTPDGNTDSVLGEGIDAAVEWSPRKGESFRLVHAHMIPRGAGEKIAGSDSSSATYLWILLNK
jgi:hypothetical protein